MDADAIDPLAVLPADAPCPAGDGGNVLWPVTRWNRGSEVDERVPARDPLPEPGVAPPNCDLDLNRGWSR